MSLTLESSITVTEGVYRAVIDCTDITVESQNLFATFGALDVDVGGSFNSSATRPGDTAPVVTLTPTGGDTPTITAVIVPTVAADGTISSYTITNPGAGYNNVPTAVVSQAGGSGATVVLTVSAGAIAAATVGAAGTGYHAVPTPATFTLPTKKLKIPDQLPVVWAVDIDDHADADIRIEIWKNTVIQRIQDAYDVLQTKSTAFVGSTTTVIS